MLHRRRARQVSPRSGWALVGLAALLGMWPCPDASAQPSLRIPRVDRAPTLEDFVAGRPREALHRARSERRSAGVLMTYQLGPGTALYVAYTTGFQNVAASDHRPLERTASPSTEVGRQVIVKLSYLVRR